MVNIYRGYADSTHKKPDSCCFKVLSHPLTGVSDTVMGANTPLNVRFKGAICPHRFILDWALVLSATYVVA